MCVWNDEKFFRILIYLNNCKPKKVFTLMSRVTEMYIFRLLGELNGPITIDRWTKSSPVHQYSTICEAINKVWACMKFLNCYRTISWRFITSLHTVFMRNFVHLILKVDNDCEKKYANLFLTIPVHNIIINIINQWI